MGEPGGLPSMGSHRVFPGTGEPGGLPSMWSHRVGNDCSDLAAAAAAGLPLVCLEAKEYLFKQS